jgi:hypothetical protein
MSLELDLNDKKTTKLFYHFVIEPDILAVSVVDRGLDRTRFYGHCRKGDVSEFWNDDKPFLEVHGESGERFKIFSLENGKDVALVIEWRSLQDSWSVFGFVDRQGIVTLFDIIKKAWKL